MEIERSFYKNPQHLADYYKNNKQVIAALKSNFDYKYNQTGDSYFADRMDFCTAAIKLINRKVDVEKTQQKINTDTQNESGSGYGSDGSRGKG